LPCPHKPALLIHAPKPRRTANPCEISGLALINSGQGPRDGDPEFRRRSRLICNSFASRVIDIGYSLPGRRREERSTMRIASSIVSMLVLTVLATTGESSAQSVAGRTARTVATFDNVGEAPGVPEGITTDGKDGLYVSLFVLDQIWHVNPATGE